MNVDQRRHTRSRSGSSPYSTAEERVESGLRRSGLSFSMAANTLAETKDQQLPSLLELDTPPDSPTVSRRNSRGRASVEEHIHPNLSILAHRRAVQADERQSRTSAAQQQAEPATKRANQRALHVLAGIRQTRPTRGSAPDVSGPQVLGSLTKRGSRFPHMMQRRSFVFYPETRELRYFEGAALRGSMHLVGIDVTEAHGVAHGIYFEGEQRMLLAAADSEKEQARWLAAVQASLLRAACGGTGSTKQAMEASS